MSKVTKCWIDDPPMEYMGTAELAEYLNTTKQNISNMKARGKLPEPVAELAMSPIWIKEQFKDWKKDE